MVNNTTWGVLCAAYVREFTENRVVLPMKVWSGNHREHVSIKSRRLLSGVVPRACAHIASGGSRNFDPQLIGPQVIMLVISVVVHTHAIFFTCFSTKSLNSIGAEPKPSSHHLVFPLFRSHPDPSQTLQSVLNAPDMHVLWNQPTNEFRSSYPLP
ncbi:hypothetical protein K503DRAFT_143689 [Rhizopogon vinicolor AM-OR11-026]|uniref:Uncharacterized protein n=1 Tax=Rhizopogon vinicolor AM-OR11-026 TaxID=1314800 RepID=A0A1B7MEC2_9AGAM|nr:hypothetical protein K503DRAFT_143689 [Rhizopogon vinicolor AM-OR11-026]